MTGQTEQSPLPVAPRRVFLSYARADGRDFAKDLHERLEKLGHVVWRDTVDMAGGQDWWVQIEDRIRQADTAVLVVTPAAMKSPVVHREWLHARRIGTPCFPVTADAEVFKSAPRWLGQVDVFVLAPGHPDLATTWLRFADQIQSPPPIRPVPFMVPGLPPEFVPRDRPRGSLVRSFLDDQGEEPAFATAIVEGPPGFGKTVLAQEVCHDQKIVEAFTGGILWVSLGEHGQGALSGMNALVSALSGAPVAFNTPEEGEPRLTGLLAARDCLLVLDDVWDAAHAAPFLASMHVARLITTRSADAVAVKDASVCFLDEMEPEEAAHTLFNFLPSKDLDADGETVRSSLAVLAGRLGEWPLLLGIFGGTLRTEIEVRRRSFLAAVKWLQEGLEEVGLTAFDRRSSEDRSAALGKSVELSLRPYTEVERRRLFELAVFPPGERIPEEVALRLWSATSSMKHFAGQRLLLEFGGTFFRFAAEGKSDSLALRFHDALREYLAAQLSASCVKEVHRLLVGSYLPPGATPDGVADDGYLYDHLAYHLRSGGDGQALHALFKDPRWFLARFSQRSGTYDGLLADVKEASDAAFDAAGAWIAAGDPPGAVVELARYRLMRSTVYGLANRLPTELAMRAVELGLRTPLQLVSIAASVPDPSDRVRMLQRLLDMGSGLANYRKDVERLAVQTALEWREPSVYALAELADRLQGAQRDAVLRQALKAARDNVATFAALSRDQESLGIRDSYSSERELAHALAALAGRLACEDRKAVTAEGLGIARGMTDVKERAHALAAWMKVTEGDAGRTCYLEALKAAREVENQQERLFALSAISLHAGADDRRELLDHIWKEAASISDEPWRAFCLVGAVAQFDDDRRRQCVELALRCVAIERENQAEAWATGHVLIPKVQPLLALLVPSLFPGELSELRAVIEKSRPSQLSVRMVLLELGLPLTDRDVEALFEEILERRRLHYGNERWPSEFAKLAPHLPEAIVTRALDHAKEISNEESWALADLQSIGGSEGGADTFPGATDHGDSGMGSSWLLKTGAPPMDAEQLSLELQRVEQLPSEREKTHALLPLISQLPVANLHEPWRIAAGIHDGWYRSQPLAALSLRLAGGERDRAASEAVAALLEPGPANADRRACIIEQLVPVLTLSLVTRLLHGVAAFEEWGRIRALKAFFPLVQSDNLEDALAAVRGVTNDSTKAELLQLLVRPFGEDEMLKIAEAAEEIADESCRVPLLELISGHVFGRAHDTAWAAAKRLSLSRDRAKVMARLLPAAASKKEALLALVRGELADALHHGPQESRAQVLSFLADRHLFAGPVLDAVTVEGVIQAANEICSEWPWQ
ncbi:TIR domain-containing protein [Geomonas sp. RF6]|uniref:toll/interleukin-1 receptor domain-containing protein n=1 Tax=Geomonas sp. RF6 TaxID=2897342 RepID=UPI001E46E3A6|nr:toll/interleukin-1 receptor domain-containing protein [Geomonas sp. RF6]UFS69449.1 TIR domain-containing protein [Geomonas sp. RF6]